ncbi:MAG: Asp-tRNA(Asn)/Glu-tRNA(Gln) amidotransferase subunit GatB, partial [Desulfobacterales bacterium]
EICLKTFNNPKLVSNWIMGPLVGALNAAGKSIDASPVSPENLGRLLQLIEEGVISGKIAKTVFDEMAVSGHAPERIVKERGLVQVSDAGQIEAAVDKVMAANADEVQAYRSGKTKLLGFFVGQVMRETKGKANPQVVNEVLKSKLSA